MVPSWLLDLLGVLLLVTAAVTAGLLAHVLAAIAAGSLCAGCGLLALSWRYGKGGDADGSA